MWWEILIELITSLLFLLFGMFYIWKGIENYKEKKFITFLDLSLGTYFLIKGIVFVVVYTLDGLGILNINLW